MRICSACGEENPDRAQFCLACGQALDEPAPVGEERKVVSVLFVDLVGFTDRSDRADPEDVRATLRPYHERVKTDIERFGGTVEKFIGDAVMAVFGAPVVHEDDAERAVRSALRILETVEQLREDGLDVAVRAAVTTGEAVVALGARPERGEGIVAGDVVNTAARLQGAAPVGAVIVDETTMRSSEGVIAFEPLEAVAAKGKAEPIPVWQALAARSRVGEPETARRAAFVGREHERALLNETFLRVERESQVQLVTVVGEPGVGKSRLVTELRAALDERPELVGWRHGRCLPYGEGITFWALGEIVKAEAGILESDDREEAVAKVEQAVSALFDDESERGWFASRLAPLAGAGDEEATASREETFTAWRRFLEAMAARRPTVFVVEDLHWADAALLDFLEEILDWAAPVPLLLLTTARPELYERRPGWSGGKRNATTISLSPLSRDETAKLLQELLERTLLPAETQEVLLERAGGNPLYAEQFARMLTERGSAADLAIPETVQALIAARLDTLPIGLKGLLHDAAVVGRTFWSGALASMAEGRNDVSRDLRELVRSEFVRPILRSSVEGEHEYAFWHALVRDVAYQQIPRRQRAEKHLAAAAWIEETAGERVSDQAEILVHHFQLALDLTTAAGEERPGLRERLASALVLAGDRARGLDAPAAVAAYRRALELYGPEAGERGVTLIRLGEALFDVGGPRAAIQTLEEAVSVLREAGDRRGAGVALRALGNSLWVAGETARAREASVESIALLEDFPGKALVRAYGSAAIQTGLAGRTDEAKRLVELGLRAASELGIADARSLTRLLGARSTVLGYSGDPAGVEDQRASLEICLQAGLGHDTAVGFNNLASWLNSLDGPSVAMETIHEGIAFAQQRGLTQLVQWMRAERLAYLYELGEWDRLVGDTHDLLAWASDTGGRQIELGALIQRTMVSAHRGQTESARRDALTMLPRAREVGDPQILLPALDAGALAHLAAGDADSAASLLREAVETTGEMTIIWKIPPPQVIRVCVAAGRIELARLMLEHDPPPVSRKQYQHLGSRAIVAEAEGMTDEAARLYAEAAESWGTFGNVVEQAYALLGLGRCGDSGAGGQGEAIFERLGARPILALADARDQQQA